MFTLRHLWETSVRVSEAWLSYLWMLADPKNVQVIYIKSKSLIFRWRTLQSLSHFLCYIFRILTNSGNWQSVTRIQYKQRRSLNFHKMALKSNSWKDDADAILENSMKILEVVRSRFWCDTGLPPFWCSELIWHSLSQERKCQHLVFNFKWRPDYDTAQLLSARLW